MPVEDCPRSHLAALAVSNAHCSVDDRREAARGYIANLSDVEIESVLSVLSRNFKDFIREESGDWNVSYAQTLATVLHQFSVSSIPWNGRSALLAIQAIVSNGGDFYQDAKLIRAIARSGIVIDRGHEADCTFEQCAERFRDVGQGIGIRKALHQIFGRIYIPKLQTAVRPYEDVPFLRFLADLVRNLEHLARVRGDEAGAVAGVLHRQLVYPLNREWILDFEQAYRTWETEFGDYRWLEVLPPQWPGDRYPALMDHLLSAKGSIPTHKWLVRTQFLIDEYRSDAVENLLVQQASDFASGEVVAESESLWIAKARVYAQLHELYSNVPASVDPVRAKLGPTAIYTLPWIGSDRKVREHCPLPNPISVSTSNTAMMKGVAWTLSRFKDEAAVRALKDLITGGAASIDTVHGPRTRALAVANAAVWALAQFGTNEASVTLHELQEVITEPRTLTAVKEAVKGLS